MKFFHPAFAIAGLATVLLAASPAHATWRLYLSGDVGYSVGIGTVDGVSDFIPPDPVPLTGDDSDVSPLVGGAFGIEIPMDELTPWRMPRNWRLPDWPVRFELEAVGLREWEWKTPGQTPGAPLDRPFNTKAKSWSVMTNLWLDIPLRGLHRPIAATSRVVTRRSRLPRVKRFLEPLTWNVGVGIGAADMNVQTSDSLISGRGSTTDFAWQAGTGFGYQLTDRVNLGVGYRYIRPGDVSFTLTDGTIERGRFGVTTDVHEARFSLRVRIADIPVPWR